MTILQTLKKFFLDDPIARTKKVYFWLLNYIGMRFPILYMPFYYWYVLRPMHIDKEKRVGMLICGSVIVYGCNLRCEFCCAFSPHLKGFCPADKLLKSYAQWRKKIKPWYFMTSGGEPLLHPELARILRGSAAIWNDSELWLTTNGLLLNRVPINVLKAIKETGYKVIVTEHTFDPEHRKKLDAGYARLKQEGISFVVRPSRLTWLAWYQYDMKGNCVPHKSNPKKAWYSCTSRHGTAIVGDKLYKCSYLSYFSDDMQKGTLNVEVWKAALTYQPLTLESTPEEIVKHLRQREIPECSVCPERCVIVPARQIPLKKTDTAG